MVLLGGFERLSTEKKKYMPSMMIHNDCIDDAQLY